jgi:hypothetical protein
MQRIARLRDPAAQSATAPRPTDVPGTPVRSAKAEPCGCMAPTSEGGAEATRTIN